MKADLRDKWLQALRSGDYAQQTARLRGSVGYCCLGVLCDVSGAGEWKEDSASGWVYRAPNGLAQRTYLPPELAKGLPRGAGRNLVEMNDSMGMTFPEIADWIEANVPAEAE